LPYKRGNEGTRRGRGGLTTRLPKARNRRLGGGENSRGQPFLFEDHTTSVSQINKNDGMAAQKKTGWRQFIEGEARSREKKNPN